MDNSRHSLSNYRARHAGVPQPGNPGWRPERMTAGQIVLPIVAGLLGLAVTLLVLYRVAFE